MEEHTRYTNIISGIKLDRVPPELSLSFGTGYDRVRRILAYTMSSPVTKDLVHSYITREANEFTYELSGTSLGYNPSDSLSFYERIKSEVEEFGYKVSYTHTLICQDGADIISTHNSIALFTIHG